MYNSAIKEVASARYVYTLVLLLIQSLPCRTKLRTKVVNKANSVLGFLQCNLKYCPPKVKANCYKSLVISILEYACTIWSLRFQKDINSIEMVQRRIIRFVFNA